jgi:hypothetical protein
MSGPGDVICQSVVAILSAGVVISDPILLRSLGDPVVFKIG